MNIDDIYSKHISALSGSHHNYNTLEKSIKAAMEEYAQSQLSEAREAPTDEEMKKRFCSILDSLQYDGRFQPNRQDLAVDEFIQYVLSTQKPEEGKEPDNTLNCNCTSDRQTPMINGKHICSICNKPLY